MKILCLYHNNCAVELFEWLRSQGHETVLCSWKLDAQWCRRQSFDLTVSYTYRFILPADVLHALGNNAVNIHNAYLPWNRGADPNIWSILESTPRGVTLHYMNEQTDCGAIIAQCLLGGDIMDDTLSSSYWKLDQEAKKMFKKAFSYYGFWKDMKKIPEGKGSFHSLADGKAVKEQLIKTYDMGVRELLEKYAQYTDRK